MKENVRKYFMAGTDEEVQLGDVISQELVKDFKDGRKLTRTVEFKLTEDTLPYALDLGIIEYEEESNDEEQKDDLINFSDEPCDTLSDLIEDFEALEDRVDSMEKMIKDIYSLISSEVKKEKEKKDASSKKK